jgi:Flp pilus assembly protein TadG
MKASLKPPARLHSLAELWADAAREEGSVLVELAFSFGVWCLCAFGVIWGSLLLYADHYVALAAKEGARYAVVHGSNQTGGECVSFASANCTASASDVTSYVQSTVPPVLTANNISINVTWPGTTTSGATCDTSNGANSPNCAVNVQVGYDFGFPLPFLQRNLLSFNSSSSLTILQ